MAQAQVVIDPLAVAVDVGGLGILAGVAAALVTAIVALRKSKPEASEIVVRMSMQLTERQQALLEDRDDRLAALEQKYGVLQNTVDELHESLERAEHERDKAVERARLAEQQAERAEARATAAEAEVGRLRERLSTVEDELTRLRAQVDLRGTKE